MRRTVSLVLLAVLIATPILLSSAQVSYEIEEEAVVLEVESSGDVLLSYNLTVKVLSGTVSEYVSIGMPSRSFDILEALEISEGAARRVESSKVVEDSYYAVKIHPSTPIRSGESRTYYLEARVRKFVYEDLTNPGNVGFRFIPSWYDASVKKFRLWVVLPPGVKSEEVRNQPDYDNLMTSEDGRIVLYWERSSFPPNYKFDVGVSFPKEYVSYYSPVEEGNDLIYAFTGLFFLAIVVVSIVLIVRYAKEFIEKRPYQVPEVIVESLGVNKNLEPPEVAYLKKLEGRKISYGRILAIIAMVLSYKGFISIRKLEPLEIERSDEQPSTALRAYEREFLRCLDVSKRPSEDCLVNVMRVLHKRVNREIAGYSRLATITHYEKLVSSIWRRISQEPLERRLELLKENLPWLLTDENFEENLKRSLRENVPSRVEIVPIDDTWVWIPRRWGTVYLPRPVPEPAPRERDEGRVDVPVITDIERAADSIARSIESFSSSIVRNLEDFSDRVARVIVPERPRSSNRRARLSCVCVSCACACACVSCACACAGGGVR